MSDNNDLIVFGETPPAPMSIFEERVVHPDNQARLDALKDRLDRFKPIPFTKRFRMQWRLNRLHRALRRRGVLDVVALLNALYRRRLQTYTAYLDARGEARELVGQGQPIPPELRERGQRLKAYGKWLGDRMTQLEAQIEPHAEMYTEYVHLRDRLIEHIELVKRHKEEERNRRQFHKEGKLVQKGLKEAFLMTEGCHIVKYTRGGKTKKVAPRFQELYLSSMVHSLVLLTSKKTIFGWKNKLQVNIEKLIDERTTLKNAGAILHRQVWVDWDRTGSLPIFKVNRLDVRDGLPERVLFAGLLEIYPVNLHEQLALPVGLGADFRAQWLVLDKLPHILIAGTTGSGKSNYANVVLCTLLYMYSPEEVRILAIDNKEGVEFFRYAPVPHLMSTISDTGDKVLPSLNQAVQIMTSRLKRLKEANAKNIRDYNASVEREQRMPRLVVFIDEMNVLVGREDTPQIHNALIKLSALGRAAGVHLVAATQYPNADTIPVAIKNNLDNIVLLHVGNVNASRMLLNNDDAFNMEENLGRAIVARGGKQFKVQTPYISDSEIDRAIRYACQHYKRTPFVELDRLEDTAPVEIIPVEPEKLAFTERDLLMIVFDNFNGFLNADRIYEVVKSQDVTTVRQVREIVSEIRRRGDAELDGVKYRVERGRGKVSQLIAVDELESSESDPAIR